MSCRCRFFQPTRPATHLCQVCDNKMFTDRRQREEQQQQQQALRENPVEQLNVAQTACRMAGNVSLRVVCVCVGVCACHLLKKVAKAN